MRRYEAEYRLNPLDADRASCSSTSYKKFKPLFSKIVGRRMHEERHSASR